MKRLCIFCEHFSMLDAGERRNESAELRCIRGEWFLYLNEGEASFRKAIRKAENCPHYEKIERNTPVNSGE